MCLVVIFESIQRVVWNNVLLTSQKATQIRSKCLAVASHLRVTAIATDVVQEIVSNVRTTSKREASSIRKCILWVQKSLVRAGVLCDVFLQFIEIFGLHVVTAEL
jgi:hypothetical protein